MQRQSLFIVTALGEGVTGLALLSSPTIVLSLLLGASQPVVETTKITARIAGAALVALAVACWWARSDRPSPSQMGLLCGMLIYDSAAALLLAAGALRYSLVGVALWPAVVLHLILALWCLLCLAIPPRPSSAIHH